MVAKQKTTNLIRIYSRSKFVGNDCKEVQSSIQPKRKSKLTSQSNGLP